MCGFKWFTLTFSPSRFCRLATSASVLLPRLSSDSAASSIYTTARASRSGRRMTDGRSDDAITPSSSYNGALRSDAPIGLPTRFSISKRTDMKRPYKKNSEARLWALVFMVAPSNLSYSQPWYSATELLSGCTILGSGPWHPRPCFSSRILISHRIFVFESGTVLKTSWLWGYFLRFLALPLSATSTFSESQIINLIWIWINLPISKENLQLEICNCLKEMPRDCIRKERFVRHETFHWARPPLAVCRPCRAQSCTLV